MLSIRMYDRVMSVFSRIFAKKPKNQDLKPAQHVDITRVVPDFKPTPAGNERGTPISSTPTPERRTPQTTTQPEDLAEAAVASLVDKHDAWAKKDLESLKTAWSEAKQKLEMNHEHLLEVARASHNLKGMATTYGHPAVSRLASSLCTLLQSGRANDQHALINLHVEACRAAYLEGKASNEGADQVAQSVCVALETQVKRTLEASA